MARFKKKGKGKNKSAIFWTVFFGIITILGVIISIFTFIIPGRSRLVKDESLRLVKIEEKLQHALELIGRGNENVQNIQRNKDISSYIDGLPFASPDVASLFSKGIEAKDQYKWDKAIDYFNKAKKDARASQLVALYSLLGECYHSSRKIYQSFDNYKLSLNLARNLDDKEGMSSALCNMGKIYVDMGDLDQAMKYSYEALDIDREIGNKKGQAADLRNIGIIYYYYNDYNKAKKYYSQSLELNILIGNKKGEASALHNISLIYQQTGDYERALDNYFKSLEINKEARNRIREQDTYYNIASVYILRGDLDNALKYLKEALVICQEIGLLPETVAALIVMSRIYRGKADFKQAEKVIQDALLIIKEIDNKKKANDNTR